MGDLGLFKLQTHLEIICALTRIPRLGLGLKKQKNPKSLCWVYFEVFAQDEVAPRIWLLEADLKLL